MSEQRECWVVVFDVGATCMLGGDVCLMSSNVHVGGGF